MIRLAWLAPLRQSVVAWLTLAALALPVAAQQRSSTEIAAGYLSPHTVAGVRVDLDRIDLNTLRRKAQQLEIIDREEDRQIGQGLVLAQGTIGGLIATGAEDLWILVDPRNPNEGVMAVLTVAPGPDAFAIPSDDHRRAALETAPRLPGPFAGIDLGPLFRDGRTARADLTIAPQLSLNIAVDAASADGAAAIASIMNRLAKTASEMPEMASQPEFGKLVGSLTWKSEGNAAVFSMVEGTPEFQPLIGAMNEAVAAARVAAARSASSNNQKQLMLALHNYYDTYRKFPDDIVDANGKPLLSWRVRLLPYIEQQALYNNLKLDEPWDSEHNRQFSETMIRVFRGPSAEGLPPGMTTYLRPIAEGTLFGPKGATDFREVLDGTSNTIALVEATAEHAVPWMKPADLAIDPQDPAAGLFFSQGASSVAFLDGSVRAVAQAIDKRMWMHLFMHADGNVVNID